MYHLTSPRRSFTTPRPYVLRDTLNAQTNAEKGTGMATSIRLSPETERRLAFLAEQTGRTRAFYLRECIDRGLEDIEDYYLAAEILERVRKGQEQVHDAEDVKKSLDA